MVVNIAFLIIGMILMFLIISSFKTNAAIRELSQSLVKQKADRLPLPNNLITKHTADLIAMDVKNIREDVMKEVNRRLGAFENQSPFGDCECEDDIDHLTARFAQLEKDLESRYHEFTKAVIDGMSRE